LSADIQAATPAHNNKPLFIATPPLLPARVRELHSGMISQSPGK
jgi:hypothetical protein